MYLNKRGFSLLETLFSITILLISLQGFFLLKISILKTFAGKEESSQISCEVILNNTQYTYQKCGDELSYVTR